MFMNPIKATNAMKIMRPNGDLPILVKYIDPITPAMPTKKLSMASA